MFTKSSQVLGKSFLSSKDSKSFRDILYNSHTVQNLAALWIENSSILLPCDDERDDQKSSQKKTLLAKLLMSWLGINMSANSISFTAEIVQGVVRGTENAGKVRVGAWSLRDAAFPIALAVLPDGSSSSRISLPHNADDVTLSLQSLLRVAQLWQLVLAAAFIERRRQDDDEDEGQTKATAATTISTSDKKDKDVSRKQTSDDEDEEGEDANSNRDSNRGGGADDSNENDVADSESQVDVIFKIAELLFPSTLSSANEGTNETLLRQSLQQQQSRGQLQIFPCVHCHAEVTDRIFRGSDLMAAGTFYQGRMVKFLKPGHLTWIVPFGHYIPVAIGPLHEDIILNLPPPPPPPPTQPSQLSAPASTGVGKNSHSSDNDEQVEQEEQVEANHQINERLQLHCLQEYKRQHCVYRASMPSYCEETKAIKIITFLGDLLWKSHEVGFAKSCHNCYFAFATQGGKLAQEEKCSLNLLMGQLAQASSSSSSSSSTSNSFAISRKNNASKKNSSDSEVDDSDTCEESDKEDESDEDEHEEEIISKKNKKNKPIPKKAGGTAKNQQNQQKPQQQKQQVQQQVQQQQHRQHSSAIKSQPLTQQHQQQQPSHVILLRWLLNECSPSPFPPGVVLSSPPKIIVSENEDDTGKNRNEEDLFATNNQAAFALLVASLMSSLRKEASLQATIVKSTSTNNNSNISSKNNSTDNTSVPNEHLGEEILQAAAFVTLSSITKDQLPLPLSQFGAKLQGFLPTSVASSLLEWGNTRWKKPINFLREYAKPSKLSSSPASIKKAAKLSETSTTTNIVDLQTDWVVELVEQGQGNFVIQSINKNSRVFREHKKSTDTIHELVRRTEACADSSANNTAASGGGAGGGDGSSALSDSAQAQGSFISISPGFLSHRSGLTPELDLVIFGDPKEAQKLTAAAAEAKEKAKFPSLSDHVEQQHEQKQNQKQHQGVDDGDDDYDVSDDDDQRQEFEIDDFVSVEDARRKLLTYARAGNFIITKQDAASTTTSSPGAKPGDLKIQNGGALRGFWGVGSSAPISASIDDIMKKLTIQVQKGTLLRFKNGNQEIRRGTPPYLVLSARQVHNHWVTTLTGQFGYYLDINLAAEIVKKKLACSARIEDAVATKNQAKNSCSLILSGRHVEDLVSLFQQEFGVGEEWIQLVNVAAKKNNFKIE